MRDEGERIGQISEWRNGNGSERQEPICMLDLAFILRQLSAASGVSTTYRLATEGMLLGLQEMSEQHPVSCTFLAALYRNLYEGGQEERGFEAELRDYSLVAAKVLEQLSKNLTITPPNSENIEHSVVKQNILRQLVGIKLMTAQHLEVLLHDLSEMRPEITALLPKRVGRSVWGSDWQEGKHLIIPGEGVGEEDTEILPSSALSLLVRLSLGLVLADKLQKALQPTLTH